MKEMTSLERCLAVLDGRIPDRIPVVPQAFMFSAFMSGYQIGEINRRPDLLAQSHVNCQAEFGYDGCVIDVDDATLAEACGARVHYRDDNVATVDESSPILSDLRAIHDLKRPDPYNTARLPQWLEITQRLKQAIGDHVFIMGRADQGPFDLLCMLRGSANLMMDLITEDESVILDALAWATEVHIDFARAQLAVGAHATSMGDAYAGPELISPEMYRKFAFDLERHVVESVQLPNQPYAIHICGDTTKIVEDMGRTGAKILELDWKVDMGYARQVVPRDVVLMGNIDPSDPLCFGTPEQVDEQCKNIIWKTKGHGLFLSSGCAMGMNTKPENLRAMVQSAAKYGQYDQLVSMQQ
jgi:MtaA/CmuA family methyltransferase